MVALVSMSRFEVNLWQGAVPAKVRVMGAAKVGVFAAITMTPEIAISKK